MSFTIKSEKQHKMTFLDVQINGEGKTFTTFVYVDLTLVEFIHTFTALTAFYHYKFGTVYTLACRCFRMCSSWTKFHTELVCLKQIFSKNGYPKNLINYCFKNVMDNLHVVKQETTLTVEKKPLVLVLPYLGSIPQKLELC